MREKFWGISLNRPCNSFCLGTLSVSTKTHKCQPLFSDLVMFLFEILDILAILWPYHVCLVAFHCKFCFTILFLIFQIDMSLSRQNFPSISLMDFIIS